MSSWCDSIALSCAGDGRAELSNTERVVTPSSVNYSSRAKVLGHALEPARIAYVPKSAVATVVRGDAAHRALPP